MSWKIEPGMTLRAIQRHEEKLFVAGRSRMGRWMCQADDDTVAYYGDEMLWLHFEPVPDESNECRPNEPLTPAREDGMWPRWPHYWSTYCIHGQHGSCRLTCKVCDARCRCDCHQPKPPLPRLQHSLWVNSEGSIYAYRFHSAVARITLGLADDGQSYVITEQEDLR